MSKKKLFIFEFVSGGGFNQEEIPASLFCEGYGMLRVIISDFKKLNFEISILLDYRIEGLSSLLHADFLETVERKHDYLLKFEKMVKKNDHVFIIAPEFSNILYRLTKIVKTHEKMLLSIDLQGIDLASSKLNTYKFFKSSNVQTPQTFLLKWGKGYFDENFVFEKFKSLDRPIVIKPEDGVGADSIFYFENENSISEFFNNPEEKLDITANYILQEYIEGKDLSVSLIGDGKSPPIILSINAQNIDIKNPMKESEYLGGYTPIEDFIHNCSILKNYLNKMDFSLFTGYFGIDFLKKPDNTICFIEINPRLTTSYLGIRNIIDINPAKLILDSKLGFEINSDFQLNNYSQFRRFELNYTGREEIDTLYKIIIPKLSVEIPELITPPISFGRAKGNQTHFSCFIATCENNLVESEKRIKVIMKIFNKFNFEIIK